MLQETEIVHVCVLVLVTVHATPVSYVGYWHSGDAESEGRSPRTLCHYHANNLCVALTPVQ